MSDTQNPTPESSESDLNPAWVVAGAGVLLVALLPATVVTALLVRVAARLGRLPVSTLAAVSAVVTVLAVFTGFPNPVAMVTDGIGVWKAVLAGDTELLAGVDLLVGIGGLWAVAVGLLAGTGWVWWVRQSRPEWVSETELRSTPWQWWKRRATVRAIQSGKGLPGGVTVGVNVVSGERVTISNRAATGHTLCTGGTGAGKTVDVLNQLVDAAAAGDPIVYVDLKGGPSVPEWLAGLAAANGRRFQHFLIQDVSRDYVGPSSEGPAFYNPAGYGDATRRKDLLTASSGSSVEYYANQTSDYVQIVFGVLEAHPDGYKGLSAIEAAMELMSPRVLQKRAREIPRSHPDAVRLQLEADKHAANKERDFENSLATFRTYLSIFLNSTAGPWIAADEERGIDFRRTVAESGIVCFSLNSSEYRDLSAKLATVIIEDLTTLAGSMFGTGASGGVVRVVIDEFSAVGRANITNLIARGREAGFAVTLATQTLGDLRIQDPAFCDQLFGTVTNFVIHRANSEQDARLYSGLTGQQEVTRLGAQTLRTDGDLGAAVLHSQVDYVIPWTEFTELETGQAYYINKNPQKTGKKGALEDRVAKVRVVQRDVPEARVFTVPTVGRFQRYVGEDLDEAVVVTAPAGFGLDVLDAGDPFGLGDFPAGDAPVVVDPVDDAVGLLVGFEAAPVEPVEVVPVAPVSEPVSDLDFTFEVLGVPPAAPVVEPVEPMVAEPVAPVVPEPVTPPAPVAAPVPALAPVTPPVAPAPVSTEGLGPVPPPPRRRSRM